MKRVIKKTLRATYRTAKRLDTEAFRNERFDELGKSQKYLLVDDGSARFVVLTSDKVISKALFATGTFEFGTFEKVLRLLGRPRIDTLLDVGANIGTICIPALKRGYVARVLAFEPEPMNFRVLSANVYLNELEEQVQLHRMACGAKDGEELEFEISGDNSGDHRVRLSSEPGSYGEHGRKTIRVPSRTLDSMAGDLPAGDSLLWIDVQGFEGHVLSGADRVLGQGIPLVSEFWPYGMARSDSYERYRRAVTQHYRWCHDLSGESDTRFELSEASLDALHGSLSTGTAHKDLLFTA